LPQRTWPSRCGRRRFELIRIDLDNPSSPCSEWYAFFLIDGEDIPGQHQPGFIGAGFFRFLDILGVGFPEIKNGNRENHSKQFRAAGIGLLGTHYLLGLLW
jgi:hypothetical protein